MDAKKYCPTVTIDDQPVAEDAFGSHEPLARAIFEMVKTEEGGKAIALEGPWGSGKSTVVRLLKDLCDKQEKQGNDVEVRVFIFDAWAHRGDPLRHSFLQRFNDYLNSINWLDKEHLKKDLKRLARQEEEVITEPILTFWGTIVLLGAFLASAVIAVFSLEPSLEGFPDELKSFEAWLVYILLAPLAVVIFAILKGLKGGYLWLKSRPTWRLWRSEFWFGNPPQRPQFAFLLARISNPAQYTIIHRSPDPTSVEFTKTFAKAMDKVLAKCNRRLIVVVDNLDRLDAQEALSIWATMKAFFEPGIFHDTPWLSRFWLIVPYDPIGIRQLWDQTKVQEEQATAFIEKTFQVRFHVPTPVLADWYDFLYKQLQAAFPDHDRTELETVRRLYRLYRLTEEKAERPVTPRDIKLFVNNLGALHRQWKDDIPLPIQALYVLYKEKIEHNPLKTLVEQDIVSRPLLFLLNEPKWRQYLGALHFNIPPERVMHILIADRLEKALMKGKGDLLLSLHELPGFEGILEHIVEERGAEWAQERPGYLGMAAAALEELDQGISNKRPFLESIWALLYTLSKTAQRSWIPFGKVTVKGLLAILEKSSLLEREELVEIFADGIARTMPPGDEEDWEEWYHGIVAFIRGSRDLGLEQILQAHFRVPGNAYEYIQVMTRLTQEKDAFSLAPYFVPAESEHNVIQAIASLCVGGKIAADHVESVNLMIKPGAMWPWEEVATEAKNRIWTNHSVPLEEVKHLLWLMLVISDLKKKNAKTLLVDLAKRGRVFHYLHQARRERNHEVIALCMIILLEHNPTGDLQENWALAANGRNDYNQILDSPTPDDIAAFATICRYREWIKPLLELSNRHQSTRSWVSETLEHLANNNPDVFSPSLLVTEYRRLSDLLPSNTLYDLAVCLNKDGAIIDEIIQMSFDIEMAGLYYVLLTNSPIDRFSEYSQFIRESLQEVEMETWLTHLKEKGTLIDLILSFPKRRRLNLGQAFGDALEEYASLLLTEETVHEYAPDEGELLVRALSSSARITCLRRMRDYLIEKGEDTNLTPILSIFGQPIIQVLEEKADDVVRRLFKGIIEGRIDRELEWMLTVLKRVPEILEKAKSESVDDLEERVRKAHKDETIQEETRTLYATIEKEIARIKRVKKGRKPPKNAPSTSQAP